MPFGVSFVSYKFILKKSQTRSKVSMLTIIFNPTFPVLLLSIGPLVNQNFCSTLTLYIFNLWWPASTLWPTILEIFAFAFLWTLPFGLTCQSTVFWFCQFKASGVLGNLYNHFDWKYYRSILSDLSFMVGADWQFYFPSVIDSLLPSI